MYKADNYTWTYSWLSLKKNMLSTNPQSSSKENNICSHYLIWSRYNFGGRSPTLQIRKLRLRACNQKVLVSDYRTQVLPTHHITSNSVFKYPTCRQRFFPPQVIRIPLQRTQLSYLSTLKIRIPMPRPEPLSGWSRQSQCHQPLAWYLHRASITTTGQPLKHLLPTLSCSSFTETPSPAPSPGHPPRFLLPTHSQ